MLMNFLFKPFDFLNLEIRNNTFLLSGVKGSGKSSFLIKYLYLLVTSKESLPPFKSVYVNIDGFDFKKFRELAESNGVDIEFKWLDFNHFKSFSKQERRLYTEYNANARDADDEAVYIAKSVESNIDEEYKRYLGALVICDEADHYLTKKDDEFATFLRFSRHYSLEIWFITQKFQNIHDSIYNSGAINFYFRVRTPLFNFGSTRVVQHWNGSNTAKSDNLEAQYRYEVEPELYDFYDSGAKLTTGSSAPKKLIFLGIGFIVSLIFAGVIFYYILGDYIISDDTTEAISKPETIIKIDNTIQTQINQTIDNVVKCVTFKDISNCYFQDRFSSLPNDFILGLVEQNLSNIRVLYSFTDTSYLSVDDTGLSFIFNNKNTRGKDEKDN